MSHTISYVAGGAIVLGGGYLLYDYFKNKDNPDLSLVSRGTSTVANLLSDPAGNRPNPRVPLTRSHWPGSPATAYSEFCDIISGAFETPNAVPCIIALASCDSMTGSLTEACHNNNPYNFKVASSDLTSPIAIIGRSYIRAYGTGYDREQVRLATVQLRDHVLRNDTVQAAKSGEIDTFQYLIGAQGYNATSRAKMDPNNPGHVTESYMYNRLVRMRAAGMISQAYFDMIRR